VTEGRRTISVRAVLASAWSARHENPELDAEVALTDLASVAARLFVLVACALGPCVAAPAPARADTVQLKTGVILRGTAARVPGLNLRTAQQNNAGVVPNNPIVLIDDGVRHYFVPWRLVAEIKEEDDLAGLVRIKIDQRKTARTSGPEIIGGFKDVRPFNEFGHGMVTLGLKNKDLDISLGITELRPDYAKVEGLNYSWQFAISLASLPQETVRAVLQRGIDPAKEQDRKAIVLFYTQAEMYPEASRELAAVMEDFPSLKEWGTSLQPQIAEGFALKGVNEIQRRIAAGQHSLAYQYAQTFPADGVSADVARQARDIVTTYDQALDSRNRILMRLDELQGKLPPELTDQVRPLRAQIAEELHYETLPRLAAFVRSERDPDLTPQQQLALAYSGWILGESAAGLEINDAIRLWEARFLALEYIRAEKNPPRQDEVVAKLRAVEGVTVDKLVQMVPQLPLPFDPPDIAPRQVQTIEIPDPMNPGEPVEYSVVLPPEYSPHHRYPLLLVLHDGGKTPQDELRWWAGDGEQDGWAMRRGYIVIAPRYMREGETSYQHGLESHRALVEVLLHARKRYAIDSDRVAIAGHGSGGDAVFDLATAHPDLFAAAVPICGHSYRSASHLRRNSPDMSWYIISGEREPTSIQNDNARDLNDMMNKQHNVTLCEFKARGFENYREELPRLFDWLETVRRPPLKDLASFEAKMLRVTDNEFAWLTCSAFPANSLRPPAWEAPGAKISAVVVSGKITPGGTIYVVNPGRRSTLWLTPELIGFDKRLTIHVNSTVRYRDFAQPDVAATLERLAITGDRQRPVWAKVDLQQ